MKKVIDTEEVVDYNHVILYAKGWYKKTDRIQDLQRILGMRCGISADRINVRDILYTLSTIFYTYCVKNENYFTDFTKSLFEWVNVPNVGTRMYSDITTIRHAIECLLGKISIIQCRDTKRNGQEVILLNLGKPDYSILPKSEDAN